MRDRALDGLRGVAILLVFLYHATFLAGANTPLERAATWIPRIGFAGVDLFFVLSGFLITRILLQRRESPSYYRAFYARRVLRILPLYYAVLVLWLVVAPALGAADLWLPGAGPGDGVWFWLYLSNWNDGLAGHFAHPYLAVTWSLAIEEQFYLVWPWIVRWLSLRALAVLCAATIAGALALRAWLVAQDVAPLAIYVLTPFRLDTLAFGALIAVFAADPARWPRFARAARRLLPVAALALVALCAWLMETPARGPAGGHRALLARPEMQTAGYSAFALFFACLLVRTLAPGGAETAFDRVVRTGALVGLGRVSYGVYLFHNPAIALTRRWIFDPAAVEWGFLPELGTTYVLAGGVTLAAALVSWRWLESPALRLRARFPYA